MTFMKYRNAYDANADGVDNCDAVDFQAHSTCDDDDKYDDNDADAGDADDDNYDDDDDFDETLECRMVHTATRNWVAPRLSLGRKQTFTNIVIDDYDVCNDEYHYHDHHSDHHDYHWYHQDRAPDENKQIKHCKLEVQGPSEPRLLG